MDYEFKIRKVKDTNRNSILRRKLCRLHESGLKSEEMVKSNAKMVILVTWKLGSGSHCSQRKFQKPIEYSEYWVGSIRKLWQISPVMLPLGVKFSLKLRFLFKKGWIIPNLRQYQKSKPHAIVFIVICST